jgi:hypothetical protein
MAAGPEQLRRRRVADGDEDAVHRQLPPLAGQAVAQAQAGDAQRALVPSTSSTTVFQTTSTFSLANRRSCRMRSARKLVAAVDQGHLAGEVGEEERLLDRGVAAADHRHSLPR